MNEQQVATMIRDMVSSFCKDREDNPTEYVRQRYSQWMTIQEMERKVVEVEMRVKYARLIAQLAGPIADMVTTELNEMATPE